MFYWPVSYQLAGLQFSLWGNKADLSLRDVEHLDIGNLGTSARQKQNSKNLIADDFSQMWDALIVQPAGVHVK